MVYLYIGLAGAIGAISRYLISIMMLTDAVFPLATLLVNLTGCYALAFIMSRTLPITDNLKSAIGTGFIGSFTTFSAFSVETLTMIDNDYIGLAMLYIMLSVVGGIILSNLGWKTEVTK